MQPATYRTVIGQDFQQPVHPPQADPVPTNADAAEIPRYIQIYAAQVDQWCQMVNAEDILKQKLFGPVDSNHGNLYKTLLALVLRALRSWRQERRRERQERAGGGSTGKGTVKGEAGASRGGSWRRGEKRSPLVRDV